MAGTPILPGALTTSTIPVMLLCFLNVVGELEGLQEGTYKTYYQIVRCM